MLDRGRSSVIGAAGIYFGLVWLAGFAFGVVRELVLTPLMGPIWAQLGEAPFMAIVTWMVAGFVMKRNSVPPIALGLLATALLLIVETAFAIGIRGQSVITYLDAYDVTQGTVFPLLIIWFAIAPWVRTTGGKQA